MGTLGGRGVHGPAASIMGHHGDAGHSHGEIWLRIYQKG